MKRSDAQPGPPGGGAGQRLREFEAARYPPDELAAMPDPTEPAEPPTPKKKKARRSKAPKRKAAHKKRKTAKPATPRA